MIDRRRAGIAGLAASASVFVAILLHEDYVEVAAPPVKGDVCTNGFGTTQGVRCGDRVTPPKAVARALSDMQKFEGAIKKCVTVPLYQYEYDAAVSLAYNIGDGAFCKSSVVRKWNAGDYAGGCEAFLLYDKFHGKSLRGLTVRRQAEYKLCVGEPA